MGIKKIIPVQGLVAIIFTIMGLVAFNLSQPSLQNELVTSFNEWYQGTAPRLQAEADPKQTDLSLKVSITVSGTIEGTKSGAWNLPSHSLLDPTDRSNTARILQLIRESGVFGFPPNRNPAGDRPTVTFSVKDEQKQFDINIPLDEVEGNIQLKNLFKLLDVYASTPPPTNVEPARL